MPGNVHNESLRKLYEVMQRSPMNQWVGSGDIEKIAAQTLETTIVNTNLAQTDKVLDFGCGIGRTTAPIADYLRNGEAVGVDIVRPMIEFCDREVRPVVPNATFFQLSESNPLYDRHNVGAPSEAFTSQSRSLEQLTQQFAGAFDVVLAFSVFTHFTPENASQYLSFFHKVTKRAGVLLLTAFIDVPWSKFPLRVGDGGYRDCVPEEPLKYVAFGFDRLAVIAADAGFRIVRLNVGMRDIKLPLRLRNGVHSHDTLVLSKIPSLPAAFDPNAYLAANPDLRAAKVDPVRHYLASGFYE